LAQVTISKQCYCQQHTNEQEADWFFKQLVNVVEYIHNMGVAHCDLRPGNILFTQQGILEITKFSCR
jgi:serine/threonine protein kinase